LSDGSIELSRYPGDHVEGSAVIARSSVVGIDDLAYYDRIAQGDVIRLGGLHAALRRGVEIQAGTDDDDWRVTLLHALSPRQIEVLLAGGLINFVRGKRS